MLRGTRMEHSLGTPMCRSDFRKQVEWSPMRPRSWVAVAYGTRPRHARRNEGGCPFALENVNALTIYSSGTPMRSVSTTLSPRNLLISIWFTSFFPPLFCKPLITNGKKNQVMLHPATSRARGRRVSLQTRSRKLSLKRWRLRLVPWGYKSGRFRSWPKVRCKIRSKVFRETTRSRP